jgi:hypothetical protein
MRYRFHVAMAMYRKVVRRLSGQHVNPKKTDVVKIHG